VSNQSEILPPPLLGAYLDLDSEDIPVAAAERGLASTERRGQVNSKILSS